MRSKTSYLLGAAAGALAAGAAAQASETVAYSYDALGRLVAVSTSGGPNNGKGIGTCYDRAGNRTSYTVATGTPATCAPPPAPPPPPPPPSNQPPVASPDSLSAPKCVHRSVNVIANDSDPDGNVPLALTGVNQSWASIESATTVGVDTPATNGTYTVTYTVSDSLGATANGTLTVTVTGSQQCV
jgi:hypothetical protein